MLNYFHLIFKNYRNNLNKNYYLYKEMFINIFSFLSYFKTLRYFFNFRSVMGTGEIRDLRAKKGLRSISQQKTRK